MEFQPMTITKAHLTDHKGLGLSKSRFFGLLKSLFEIMKAALANGEDILRALKNAPFRSLRLSAQSLRCIRILILKNNP